MTKLVNEALLSHVLGVRSAVDLAIPTGVDAGEIFRFSMKTERTAEQVVRDAATALGAANQYLASTYGGLFTITSSLYGFTRQGETTRSMTPHRTEFRDADPIRSDVLGSMLPIEYFQDALGWTKDYLMNAVDMQLNADVEFLVERWINRFDYQLFKRMLTNTENVIGSAGYDVPWAIGTGVNVPIIPTQYLGKVFDTTHTHFVVKNASTPNTFADLFEAMAAELRHHGIRGRLATIVSEDDIATISAISANWVGLNPPGVTYIGGNAASPIAVASGEYEGIPGDLAGYFRTSRHGLLEIRTHNRMPQKYAWMTLPLGGNNAKSPFAIRVMPGAQFGMQADPQLDNSINPKLKQVNFDSDFGIGVNNRLGAVAGYLDAGAATWVNPDVDGGASEE